MDLARLRLPPQAIAARLPGEEGQPEQEHQPSPGAEQRQRVSDVDLGAGERRIADDEIVPIAMQEEVLDAGTVADGRSAGVDVERCGLASVPTADTRSTESAEEGAPSRVRLQDQRARVPHGIESDDGTGERVRGVVAAERVGRPVGGAHPRTQLDAGTAPPVSRSIAAVSSGDPGRWRPYRHAEMVEGETLSCAAIHVDFLPSRRHQSTKRAVAGEDESCVGEGMAGLYKRDLFASIALIPLD